MKKIFKLIITLVFIGTILMCLASALGILDFSDFKKLSPEDVSKYSNYYFNQLNETEQRIYIKISKTVRNNKISVNFGNIEDNNLTETIGKSLTAYINDNPDVFYISNTYSVVTRNLFGLKLNTLTIQNDYVGDINKGKKELKKAIDEFLAGTIDSSMSDYEKEIAIHDKLVKTVKYYNYKQVENIPNIKHSAYGALVEHEAVCDGYSKAFKLLLEKAGIENVIATGNIDGVPHAWNIVKIGNEYYHTDTTSDGSLEEKSSDYVIHAYFNVSDKEILKTHEIEKEFKLPKCNSDKYNYYNINNYTLKSYDDIESRLDRIIKQTKNNNVLEIKTDGNTSVQRIIDALYDLNFNLWKTKRTTNISYNRINDIFIFKNNI